MFYFHIGAPKTGTNAIQRFARANQARLAELGLVYPELGRGQRHKHDTLKTEFHATIGLGGENFGALRALAEAHPDKKILVSEEAFYNLEQQHVQRLAGGMLGRGPVTILVWFRDYAGHAVSTYGQEVKIGRCVQDFDTFLEDYLTWPRHAQVISRWGDAFGWENVQVRYYSPATLVAGDAVADCMAALGIDMASVVEPRAGGEKKSAKANISPGWESVELMRAVFAAVDRRAEERGSGRPSTALRTAIRRAVEAVSPAATRIEYLTAEQRARCNAATLADIGLLNLRLQGPALPVPTLREGPERQVLPSIALVPGGIVAAAMAALAFELGAELPDDKRARKKARLEEVAGTKKERRKARIAAGERPLKRSKAPGTRHKAVESAAPAPQAAG